MRPLLRFYLWLLLTAGAALAGLYSFTPFARLLAATAAPTVEGPGTAALPTPAHLALLRGLLSAAALAAGLGLVLLPGRQRRAGQLPGRASLTSWLAGCWQPLAPAERAVAAGLLLAVTAARVYYAVTYPLSLDELASYDYSVLPGAAVTAGFYPFPNNHILPNLLAGLVHTLLPAAPPAVALRLLPTLAGLLGLPLLYAGASRALGFRVATLGLYWLSPLGVYYAVAGRGYGWALLALATGLWAAWELLRPGGPSPARTRHRAWVVLGLSVVSGLYAVPSFLYAALALGLGLSLGFGRQPARLRRAGWWLLALTVAGTALVLLVLYLPVGLLSGWPALLRNPYVASLPPGPFRVVIGPWLLGTATELLGQRGYSAAAYALLLGLAPLALLRGRLPAPARRLGWLLLAQLVLWLPVVLAQRVLPPARTLLPVLAAFFLLAALVGRALLAGRVGEWAARSRLGLTGIGLLLAGYGSYRLHREQRIIRQQQAQQVALHHLGYWLHRQPRLRRVWVAPREYALWLCHYDLATPGRPALPLQVVDDVPVTPLRSGHPALYRSAAGAVLPVGPGQVLVTGP